MLVRKKIDYYLITAILLIFGIDLLIFWFSPSVLIPITWTILSLNIKGWICSWNHHHQHCKFFNRPWANRLLELMMGLHTGIVGELWVLHHNLGHHVNYLDQSKDESGWKTRKGKLMSQLEYTIKVSMMAYPTALTVGKRHPKSRRRLVENMILTAFVLTLLSWINWVNTVIIFRIPMVFLLLMTVYVTYDHHAGLDDQDPYQATYNITDRWYNFFTCNLGYHTAHHIQYGRHWSELPEFHEQIKANIPSHLYKKAGFPFALMTRMENKFLRSRTKVSNV